MPPPSESVLLLLLEGGGSAWSRLPPLEEPAKGRMSPNSHQNACRHVRLPASGERSGSLPACSRAGPRPISRHACQKASCFSPPLRLAQPAARQAAFLKGRRGFPGLLPGLKAATGGCHHSAGGRLPFRRSAASAHQLFKVVFSPPPAFLTAQNIARITTATAPAFSSLRFFAAAACRPGAASLPFKQAEG